ncbi:MAG TPA: sulfatase [Chloroflexota bacterium]|nr:sulfatase [Chloroflexota bacterium]
MVTGADARPHVVVLTCHDLGRHLACYGVDTVDSPNLDALADGGVLFERAFSTSSGCSPSRASIATGRYPHSNGVMGLTHPPFNWDLLPGERHTASLLADQGYSTHLFGFQHVTTDVGRLGFHRVHSQESGDAVKAGIGAEVAREVDAFLSTLPPERPAYIEINLEEPHRPYDQAGASERRDRGVFIPPYLPEGPEARDEMAALQGAIAQADAAVGRIIAAVNRSLGRNTIVVFLTDHGIAMPRAKCTLYDVGIEACLMICWPEAGMAAGARVPAMVSHVDLLPTLLSLIGVMPPASLQGQSFAHLLRGEAGAARDTVYAEKSWHSYYDPMRAIRTEQFKLILNFETTLAVEVPADVEQGAIFRGFVERYHGATHVPSELYDLASDPEELSNLAGQPQVGDIQRDLEARLMDWMRETDDPLLQGFIASPTSERMREEILRASTQ